MPKPAKTPAPKRRANPNLARRSASGVIHSLRPCTARTECGVAAPGEPVWSSHMLAIVDSHNPYQNNGLGRLCKHCFPPDADGGFNITADERARLNASAERVSRQSASAALAQAQGLASAGRTDGHFVTLSQNSPASRAETSATRSEDPAQYEIPGLAVGRPTEPQDGRCPDPAPDPFADVPFAPEEWSIDDIDETLILMKAKDILYERLAAKPKFACLFLDTTHRPIRYERLFRGTVDAAHVHPRVVVKRALQVNAAAVIVAHNHPSGVPEPSQADLVITRRLRDGLALVDIRLLDHFIVGHREVVSLAERGLV